MSKHLLASTAVACSLIFVGCGDDDDGSDGKTVSTALNTWISSGHKVALDVGIPGAVFGFSGDSRITSTYEPDTSKGGATDGFKAYSVQRWYSHEVGTEPTFTTAGAEYCHLEAEQTAVAIDGFDVKNRVLVTENIVVDTGCGQGTGQSDYVMEARDGGDLLGFWQAIDGPTEEFPGFFHNAGGAAIPFRVCMPGSELADRDYCAWTCELEDGACTLE